jgi:hypothetical protein
MSARYRHEIHGIIDRYTDHLCDDVRAAADEPGLCLHLVPPGLTDTLRLLDRAVFGALKGEGGTIDRCEMSQREDESMTKADLAACSLQA